MFVTTSLTRGLVCGMITPLSGFEAERPGNMMYILSSKRTLSWGSFFCVLVTYCDKNNIFECQTY